MQFLFQNGDTAIHIAAAMGRQKLTKILLESGCDKDAKNKQEEGAGGDCLDPPEPPASPFREGQGGSGHGGQGQVPVPSPSE